MTKRDWIRRAMTSPNAAVSFYLINSYLYYIRNQNIVQDFEYDMVCKFLLEHIDEVEHQHRYLINIDSLRAGTAFTIKDSDYPTMVKCSAEDLLRKIQTGTFDWE